MIGEQVLYTHFFGATGYPVKWYGISCYIIHLVTASRAFGRGLRPSRNGF
jgi:hypothetical protein